MSDAQRAWATELIFGLGTTPPLGQTVVTALQHMAAIVGTCLICSVTEMIFSRFIPFLKKIITPLVSGIVVLLIGANMILVGIRDAGGGAWLLMGSIFLGMLVGYIVAAFLGKVNFGALREMSVITLPIPFRFGIAVAWP